MLPNLNELLQYQNPLVIRRFKKNFPAWQERAEALFTDMLKYLWLSYKHEQDKINQQGDPLLDFSCVMHREMRIVDEMWHTFILLTKDYAEFCHRYFGCFIHHIPELGGEAENAQPIDQDIFEKELRLFLSYAYDHVGEATIKNWFSDSL